MVSDLDPTTKPNDIIVLTPHHPTLDLIELRLPQVCPFPVVRCGFRCLLSTLSCFCVTMAVRVLDHKRQNHMISLIFTTY